jgi:hypothetical protein
MHTKGIAMTTRTALGTIVGLGLGFAVVFASFAEMLLVALFAAIGYVVARVVEGDLDLGRYSPDRNRR